MNQLLIAVLISTSLTGVIQGGFVSSINNDKSQVIDQQTITEVGQVRKDDLTDYVFIDKPTEKTSSMFIQFEQDNGHTSNATTNASIEDTQTNNQFYDNVVANERKRMETKELQTKKSQLGLSKTEKAEMSQDNKVIETPKVEATDEVRDTPAKPIEDESNKNTVTTLTTELEKADEEVNTSIEHSDQVEEVLTVKATAYTADCEGGTGVTYTGIDLRANADQKVIAVDPSVIPLGTRVYVEGYGHAVAADIGGAIKGNKIDVFIPSQAEAEDWGIKTVNVKILED